VFLGNSTLALLFSAPFTIWKGAQRILDSKGLILEFAVSDVQMTDNCLTRFDQFIELEELRLELNHITDAGLQYLHKLRKLSLLGLSDNPITDAGLAHLDFPSLMTLIVRNTRVTEDGINEFKSKNPNVNIVW
jgi:hypothetical protein